MSQGEKLQSSDSELSSEVVEKTVSTTIIDVSEQSGTDSNTTINDHTKGNGGGGGGGGGGPVVQMSKIQLFLVFMGLAFGIFLAALDMTIVATALPTIAIDFNALDDIAWVGTSYLLTATAFQPTYGKISDIFGRKYTFLGAIILFEVGSLLCGLSKNMTMLIISRAVAGLGGGGIIGLVLIIISEVVPIQDRGKYQGMIGACFGIASVVGPLLGGAFTDHVTWRWAFYINLPLGAVTILCVTFLLHLPRPKGSLKEKLQRIDWLGTIVLVAATVCILLPLNWGGSTYAWNSPVVITLFIVGGLGLLLFVYVEGWVAKEPIAPGRLFRDRTIAACFAVTFWHGMAFFSLIYFVPLFYQIVNGDTATKSGLDILPLILGVVVLSISSGQLVSRTDKFSYNFLCLLGAALIIVGGGLISTLTENSNRGEQIGYMLIAGVGIGLIIQSILLAVQGIVDRKDVAAATSLLTFFRTFGAVFGVAILGTIFNNEVTKNISAILHLLPPGLNPSAIIDDSSILESLSDSQKLPIIHAFVKSLDVTFKYVIPMGALCFISVLFMRNLKPILREKEETVDPQEAESKFRKNEV